MQSGAQPASGINCTFTPAGDGNFSQNVQRLALYAEDSWRASHHLTINYGLRYQTTFGLFKASGRSQADNTAFVTLQALQIPLAVPHDYRKQIAPRLGIAYSPGTERKHRVSRRIWHVLRRSGSERLGYCV